MHAYMSHVALITPLLNTTGIKQTSGIYFFYLSMSNHRLLFMLKQL
jgi:hypothetical protein